jgi:hypothetical protein
MVLRVRLMVFFLGDLEDAVHANWLSRTLVVLRKGRRANRAWATSTGTRREVMGASEGVQEVLEALLVEDIQDIRACHGTLDGTNPGSTAQAMEGVSIALPMGGVLRCGLRPPLRSPPLAT